MRARGILSILSPTRIAERRRALAEADKKVDEAIQDLNRMNRTVLGTVIRLQHEIEERRRRYA